MARTGPAVPLFRSMSNPANLTLSPHLQQGSKLSSFAAMRAPHPLVTELRKTYRTWAGDRVS